jgi:hypothetical protein
MKVDMLGTRQDGGRGALDKNNMKDTLGWGGWIYIIKVVISKNGTYSRRGAETQRVDQGTTTLFGSSVDVMHTSKNGISRDLLIRHSVVFDIITKQTNKVG